MLPPSSYVVVREVEARRREYAMFPDQGSARRTYVDVCRMAMGGPHVFPEDEGIAVTNCWLYEVPVSRMTEVKAAIEDGDAIQLEVCFED